MTVGMDGRLTQKERLTMLVSYLILSAMMACMVATLVQLGQVILTNWDGTYLTIFSFFLSLEAIYSYRHLKGINFTERQWIVYRTVELVLIMLGIKIFFYANIGFDQLLSDILIWSDNFWEYFFTNEYIFSLLIALTIWYLTSRIAGSLIVLEVDERIIHIETETGIYESRADARWMLASDVLYIGLGMIIFTALMRFDKFVDWVELPPVRTGVYNILTYFFLALVLLSISQLNLMRARWLRDQADVEAGVARRWVFYSLALILFLMLVSLVLPTRYSVGLLGLLNYLFWIVFAILNLLATLIMAPIFFLIGLLSRLLGQPVDAQPPPPIEIPQIDESSAQLVMGVHPLIRSILFWLILSGIIIYSLVYYLREHRQLVVSLRSSAIYQHLVRFWSWLRSLVGGVNLRISSVVGAGLERLRRRGTHASDAPSWRFINPRRLSPRRQIIFYYLAMVRRGTERGLKRHPSQTPFEYSQSLSESLDPLSDETGVSKAPTKFVDSSPIDVQDVQIETDFSMEEPLKEGINEVTDKFVEARYSLHLITSLDADEVRLKWLRISRALRGSFKKAKE